MLLPLAAHGQPPSRPPSQQEQVAPVSLRSPIQFRQVAAISNASCPAGSGGLPGSPPGSAAPACFYLTGTGMTVTAVQSAQVVPSGTGGYQLEHRPHPGPDGPVCGLDPKGLRPASPRNQLAIIIDGHVIADTVVQSAIPGGKGPDLGLGYPGPGESLLASLRNQ